MAKYSRRTAYINTIFRLLIFFLISSSVFHAGRVEAKTEQEAGIETAESDSVAFGIMLILLGMVMFILELKITSYGLLTLGGVISLILGSMMLINQGEPFIVFSGEAMLAVAVISAVFLAFAMTKIIRGEKEKALNRRRGNCRRNRHSRR